MGANSNTYFSPDSLLDRLQSLPASKRYWVAFSGGLDSTCLLHAMASLRNRIAGEILALHVDHGLQAISAQWIVHCQNLCDQLGIELHTRVFNLRPISGESTEALARQARLAAYRSVLQTGDILLTAQHQDDQAETLLLQLLRGSGLLGLAAMPKFTALPPGWLARPLLEFSRSQLRTYAEIHALNWVEDPSNAQTEFDRNYLRQRIMPLLTQRWPACGSTLSRSARHCSEAANLIDDLIPATMIKARGNFPGTLSKTVLLNMDSALCNAVLRCWIREHGVRLPDSRRLERIRSEVLTAAIDRSPLVNWVAAEVRRYRDDVFLITPPLLPPPQNNIIWNAGKDCALPTNLGYLRLNPATGNGLNLDIWNQGLVSVRFGVHGARCRILGTTQRRPLKDIYQHYAIPDWLRPYIPLIYLDTELIAIAGICLCDAATTAPGGVNIIWERANLSFSNLHTLHSSH